MATRTHTIHTFSATPLNLERREAEKQAWSALTAASPEEGLANEPKFPAQSALPQLLQRITGRARSEKAKNKTAWWREKAEKRTAWWPVHSYEHGQGCQVKQR